MKAHIEPVLTLTDLEAMPDDGNRYELIEGELFVSTAPGLLHQMVVGQVFAALFEYLRKNPIGTVVLGPGIVFDEFSGVIPDLVFFTQRTRAEIATGERLTGAPELVVEVLSPGAPNEQRDRKSKRQLYSVRGVNEYWVFNPAHRTIEVYRSRKTGGLALAATLKSRDELMSPLLPQFRCKIAHFFES